MSNFSFRISGHSEEEIMISLKLVKDSFGNTDIASKSYYQWQYLQNPVGQGTVLLAYQDDKPAGQFACIPCRYRYATEDLAVPLTLNLCVLPKSRGRGLMSQLITRMHSYLETEYKSGIDKGSSKKRLSAFSVTDIGKTSETVPVFGGGSFRLMLSQLDVIWKKRSNNPHIHMNGHTSDGDVDESERYHSSDKILIQFRDHTYLNWRYWHNPSRQYTAISYRNDDLRLEGYAMVRTSQINGKKVSH
jgi:GNAT superfamily N-acetyltransferase